MNFKWLNRVAGKLWIKSLMTIKRWKKIIRNLKKNVIGWSRHIKTSLSNSLEWIKCIMRSFKWHRVGVNQTMILSRSPKWVIEKFNDMRISSKNSFGRLKKKNERDKDNSESQLIRYKKARKIPPTKLGDIGWTWPLFPLKRKSREDGILIDLSTREEADLHLTVSIR